MTALKNVAIAPMKVRGLPEKEAYDRAHDLLKKVGLVLHFFEIVFVIE